MKDIQRDFKGYSQIFTHLRLVIWEKIGSILQVPASIGKYWNNVGDIVVGHVSYGGTYLHYIQLNS